MNRAPTARKENSSTRKGQTNVSFAPITTTQEETKVAHSVSARTDSLLRSMDANVVLATLSKASNASCARLAFTRVLHPTMSAVNATRSSSRRA